MTPEDWIAYIGTDPNTSHAGEVGYLTAQMRALRNDLLDLSDDPSLTPTVRQQVARMLAFAAQTVEVAEGVTAARQAART